MAPNAFALLFAEWIKVLPSEWARTVRLWSDKSLGSCDSFYATTVVVCMQTDFRGTAECDEWLAHTLRGICAQKLSLYAAAHVWVSVCWSVNVVVLEEVNLRSGAGPGDEQQYFFLLLTVGEGSVWRLPTLPTDCQWLSDERLDGNCQCVTQMVYPYCELQSCCKLLFSHVKPVAPQAKFKLPSNN